LNWLQLGIVGRAHGLRGFFYIAGRDKRPLDDDYDEVVLGATPESGKPFKVAAIRHQANGCLLACDGIENREAHAKILGLPIWVRRAEVTVDAEAEYLWQDLVGKTVVDSEGQRVGQIEQVQNHGASDIVEVSDGTRRLDLALIEEYFVMDFKASDEELHLIVPVSTFADFWR